MEEKKQKYLEYLHFKRVHFEPVVFETLKRQSSTLDTFWETYNPPLTSKKAICIVERREHKNFEFILKNVCYFSSKSAEEWSVYIVCSDENYTFVKDLTKNKSITVLPYFHAYGSPEQGKQEYNTLLQERKFWSWFDADWILTVEMDSYLLRPLPQEMFEYDYVASHWSWDKSSQGGGLSLRKKQAMLAICDSDQPICLAQDLWVNEGCKKLGLKTPTFVLGQNWFAESCLSLHPVGIHQFWTFWDPKTKFAMEEFFVHTHMRLEE